MLERGEVSAGRRELRCRYERSHAVTQVIEGRLCATDAWRSPVEWSFTQTFPDRSASPLLPALTESGTWRDGAIALRATAGNRIRAIARTLPAPRVLCLHAWLADFPRDLAPASWSDDILVMEDATLFTRGTAFERPRVSSASARLAPR